MKKEEWETGQIILYNGEQHIIDISYHNKDINKCKNRKRSKKVLHIFTKTNTKRRGRNQYKKSSKNVI